MRIQPCGAAVSEQDWATESSIDLRPADELRPGHNLHVEYTVSLLLLDSLSELSNKVNLYRFHNALVLNPRKRSVRDGS